MLEIWKTDETGLRPLTLETIEPGSWISLIHPSGQELNKVEEFTNAPHDFIRAPLDPEESSRIEVEDDHILILVNVPIDREDINEEYDTIPLGIIMTENYIVTICQHDNAVFDPFTKNRFRTFSTFKRTRFVLQMLYRTAMLFLKDLRQMSRKSDMIEQDLRRSMQNKELFQMLNLQKGLTYYSMSVRSNRAVIERILRLCSNPQVRHIIKLREEDEDLLDDVRVEYDQAVEMTQIQTDVLAGMMDAFASVISNNLNIVMKFLASVTIVMAVPSIISGLFGMNVQVPWTNNQFGFAYACILTVGVVAAAIYVLWKKGLF